MQVKVDLNPVETLLHITELHILDAARILFLLLLGIDVLMDG